MNPPAAGLVIAGVDVRTVAQLKGHSTIQVTMRYAHGRPECNSAAIERLVGFKTTGRAKASDRPVTKWVTGKSKRPGMPLKPA